MQLDQIHCQGQNLPGQSMFEDWSRFYDFKQNVSKNSQMNLLSMQTKKKVIHRLKKCRNMAFCNNENIVSFVCEQPGDGLQSFWFVHFASI